MKPPLELLAGFMYWSYSPVPEIPVVERREAGKVAWDALSFYDCEAGVVKVHDGLIANAAFHRKLSYLWLRELARLHGHAHAFLHRAQLSPPRLKELLACPGIGSRRAEEIVAEASSTDPREWYTGLPKEVLEPLTELVKQVTLSWSLGPRALNLARSVEERLGVPSYYRGWRNLEELVKSFRHPSLLLAIILCAARRRIWKRWSDLSQEIAGLIKEAGGARILEVCLMVELFILKGYLLKGYLTASPHESHCRIKLQNRSNGTQLITQPLNQSDAYHRIPQ